MGTVHLPDARTTNALLIVGHGSLRKASGAAMIRLAALARREGLAPISTAGFLNFSRPTFAEAVTRCVAKGASNILVQPYFLIDGYYVNRALPKLVQEARAEHPEVSFRVLEPFTYHPALGELVLKRTAQVIEEERKKKEDKEFGLQRCALLLMAHGTPHEAANASIYQVAEEARRIGVYRQVAVSFMELNAPSVADGIDALVKEGAETVVAVPYFLHLGEHVTKDLPAAVEKARKRHPDTKVCLSDHLSYDPLLLNVIRDRVVAAVG